MHAEPTVIDAQRDDEAPRRAAEALRDGVVVAFPTETHYALGADARSGRGIEGVLAAKGAERRAPLLLLVDGLERIEGWAGELPETFPRLAELFWPGPLTLVVPASPGIHPALVGSGGGVGIRWSAHPLVAAIVAACGAPVTGTSANRSGRPAADSAEEVVRGLGSRVGLVVDGGVAAGGPPTTVLDLCRTPPRLLREGAIDRPTLAAHLRLAD